MTGAIGGAGAVVDGFGVSVFAGVMPGVEAVAFRVADASLPSQLTAAQWRRIAECGKHDHTRGGVRQSHTNDDDDKNDKENTGERPPFVAALTLACADFEDIETFTGRLHAAAPGAVVVGAVAKPGGALFSGSEEVTSVPTRDAKDPGAKEGERSGSAGPFGDDATSQKTFSSSSARVSSSSARASSCASHGAVGVILVGDFEMEAHSLHAHRPVGPPMTLTRAGADGVVLDLDGRAAGDALAERLADLPEGVAGMPVMLGMRDDDGFERTRSVTDSATPAERAREDDTTDATMTKTFSSREENDAPDRGRRRRGRSAWIRGRVVDDVAENISSEPTVTQKDAEEAAAEAAAVSAYGAGGAGYVYRDIVGADHETGGVFVGQHALREGSRVQLHVRDAAWGKARVKALLAKIASSGRSGNPAGAVMYTCVSGNRMHAGDFREAVAACPLGGGFVAGEIAPAERGARAALQSHTSVVAVFRERA